MSSKSSYALSFEMHTFIFGVSIISVWPPGNLVITSKKKSEMSHCIFTGALFKALKNFGPYGDAPDARNKTFNTQSGQTSMRLKWFKTSYKVSIV